MSSVEHALSLSLSPQNIKHASCSAVLTLAYQSLGVVYGDLSTSPLYVYKTTFSETWSLREDDEDIFGVLSFIFWTFTLVALFKYIFVVMSADDNGEGGTFALYSLLCRHANLGILPNQQPNDEKLSSYAVEGSAQTTRSPFKLPFGKHERFHKALLIFVLLGTCMAIGDGVLTPAISVLSAVSGVRLKFTGLHENYVVMVSCIILIVLFSLQHHGTHRVAFMFAAIVTAWLICISSMGVYNIVKWNPNVVKALSPIYMFKLLKHTGMAGWVSLGGVVLAITEPVFWPVFVVATFAAVVGSQAVITATFSVISQCCGLNCFPRVKIVHTSSAIYGQIYIPETNWMLMCLCLAVTIGLRDTNMIGHAYDLAVTTVMFVTTCLMTLVMIVVWRKRLLTALIFLLFFGFIELLYISACLFKVPESGWIPLALSSILMVVMYVWNYGTLKKHEFDMENKVSMDRIVALGPSLGMVWVPGIGLFFSNLATGVPAVFGHFVTNLPAFHQILVIVCVKPVQVPYVTEEERFLIGRVGPKEYGMFIYVIRFGYKDLLQENYDFENKVISELIRFVQTEGSESNNGNMEEARISARIVEYQKHEAGLDRLQAVKLLDLNLGNLDSCPLSDESIRILNARESGVAYIFSHSYAGKEVSLAREEICYQHIVCFSRKEL